MKYLINQVDIWRSKYLTLKHELLFHRYMAILLCVITIIILSRT